MPGRLAEAPRPLGPDAVLQGVDPFLEFFDLLLDFSDLLPLGRLLASNLAATACMLADLILAQAQLLLDLLTQEQVAVQRILVGSARLGLQNVRGVRRGAAWTAAGWTGPASR